MAWGNNLDKLVGKGENPNGFIAQTANGTIRDGHGGDGDQPRYNMADGPRWNTDPRIEPKPLDDPYAFSSPAIPRGHVAVSAYTRRKGK